MSHPAPTGDGSISRAHSLALRKEIGERLRFDLDRDITDPPPHLLRLMEQFRRAG